MQTYPTDDYLNRGSAITAALVIAVVGAIFYNILPLTIGTLQEYRQLSGAHSGLVGSLFYVGFNLTAASAFFWIRRIDWRLACGIAIVITASSLLVNGVFSRYWVLLTSIVIAGGGFGVLYAISTTLIGDTENMSRWYGIKIALEAGAGALLFLVLPSTVISLWGFEGLIIVLTAMVIAAVPVLPFLPRGGVKQASVEPSTKATVNTTNRAAVVLGLVALMVFFTGETAAWAFVERIGNSAGMDGVLVGQILSLALLFTLSGSFLAAALGARLGYWVPMLLVTGIFLLGLTGLFFAAHTVIYAASACLVMFSVGYGVPVMLASIASLDLDGRFVVLTVPAVGLGAMLAPGLAGLISDWAGTLPVLLFCASCALVALMLQFFCLRQSKNSESHLTSVPLPM
ncbi:MFS transporter [Pseudomaricurvus alkylphenolicus]|nr:MFS transporter [Pseudomaricurvus alkylphenolicus]NIB40979.1 MFS transporter [Pseudomaricurvus alkylphenolicus]